ncbi:hypothetical protein BDD12DRAFT_293256 [Trichophaea hybrida]|nr:hypothetical protein BDD12DRAFT_293256 [Trichophaea hybrida]
MEAQQDDATKMIDDLFSFDTPSILTQGPIIRRGSAPQNSTFDVESMRRTHAFPRDNSNLPTPPHSAHMQCVSTFDLAPLHPNFVNLATLNMPLENDVESYYSPRSGMASPTFSPAQQSPGLQHAGLFENSMSTVPEESFTEDSPMIKVPPLLENTTFDISETRPQHRERGETTPQPMGAKITGISMEEIASFIAGPEASDGKWVCKYPDCEKRFGRKENIKSHVQTHLGDRQYRCEVCKKCFVRQHDLKRHSKIHTGIKPYPCLCGNSFARHDALTRHRQRGMCIGAFEGIIKKVAKRGRPRKKPLNEDGTEPAKNNKSSDHEPSSSSASSSSGSDVSDPRTPRAMDNGSPPPDSPNFEQYDSSSSSSAARSIKEESPELMPYALESPDYTPPTSPPEFYEFENFTSKFDGAGSKRNSYSSSSLPDEDYLPREIDYSDFGLPRPESDNGKLGAGSDYSSDNFSPASGHGEDFMFSQDQLEMFGLTTLERDPSILGLGGEDIYIKPELLSNP